VSGIVLKKTISDHWIYILIHVALSILFFFSVYYKLSSFYDFNLFLKSIFNIDFEISRIISILLISIEFFFFFQFFSFSVDKRILVMMIIFMTIMSIFSSYLLFFTTEENCFCFGTEIKLSGTETIIKNVLSTIFLFILFKKNKDKSNENLIFQTAIFIAIFIFSLIMFKENKNYFVAFNAESIEIQEFLLIPEETRIIIDARTEIAYQYSHIPKAINIPNLKEDIDISKLEKMINSEMTLVVYCDNSNCGLARSLAVKLKRYFNQNRIYYLNGGFEKWVKLNHKH
jgi:rhodanese-related sulfurtransferase